MKIGDIVDWDIYKSVYSVVDGYIGGELFRGVYSGVGIYYDGEF